MKKKSCKNKINLPQHYSNTGGYTRSSQMLRETFFEKIGIVDNPELVDSNVWHRVHVTGVAL